MRLKHLKIFRDRHGVERCYFRPTNEVIDLARFPFGSEAFFVEYNRILKKFLGKTSTPGTLGLLIQKYKASSQYTQLANRTKNDYSGIFDFLEPLDGKPLVEIDSPFVVKVRDRAEVKHKFHFANYTKAVLSAVFTWGVERGYMTANPALKVKKVKRPKDLPAANRIWSDEERAAVLETLPVHMKLPVALMMFLAIDPQDALRLPKTAISNDTINIRRGKTGVATWLKVPAQLIKVLEGAPSHNAITLCANSNGKPWTVSGFRASWRPIKLRLEREGRIQPDLTLKGLRHTVATILDEMGYETSTIQDYLAHASPAMTLHYTRRSNKGKKLKPVVDKFEDELNIREQILSNSRSGTVKP
jgi:integrase